MGENRTSQNGQRQRLALDIRSVFMVGNQGQPLLHSVLRTGAGDVNPVLKGFLQAGCLAYNMAEGVAEGGGGVLYLNRDAQFQALVFAAPVQTCFGVNNGAEAVEGKRLCQDGVLVGGDDANTIKQRTGFNTVDACLLYTSRCV